MSLFKLDGKTAIVTGGAGGIGHAIVKLLAESGANVIIADISEKGEQAAAQLMQAGLHVSFVKTDITDPISIQQSIEVAVHTYGGLDILVNNAGIYPRAAIEETTVELWDQVMDLNLKGMFLFCQAAIPYLRNKGGGAIVNITSIHAEGGAPELFAYSVSKGGINTLTKNLANALAGDRIRVNAVNPGWVVTETELQVRGEKGQSLEDLQELGKAIPLGRLQKGEDTAAAVLFLASEASSQITGQILSVDGGKSVDVSA